MTEQRAAPAPKAAPAKKDGKDPEEDEVFGKAYDPRIVRRTSAYVRPYRRHMVWSVLLMICIAAANLVQPFLIKTAIDEAIIRADVTLLTLTAVAFVLSALISWLATYGQTYIMSWVGQSVLFSMRRELFVHLQRLSFNFYDRMEAGRIMSRMTGDVNSLNEFLTSGIVAIASDFFVLVGIVVIMFALNWELAAVTLTVVPVIAVATHLYRKRSRQMYREVRTQNAIVTGTLAENISGVRVVQAFAREEVNARKFDVVNRENLRRLLKATAFSAGFSPVITFVSTVATVVVIWYGGQKVLEGALSIGSLYAFLAYVGRFFEPINDLSSRYNGMQSAMAGGERVFELLDTPASVQDKPGAYSLPPIHGHVELDRVVFEYVPDRPVLRGISMQAQPGDVVALVGHTGAGKSSIISILLRFYDIKSGSITIDGHDIRDVTTDSLRHQVGLVLQEPFLFSGSIRDNIRYGKLDATEEQVVNAAKAVNLHEYIETLPFGYDTEVQERGSTLSQGQRQLLSFARALIADPRILILDEATSSVDTATEKLIQSALEVLMHGRTSFVIAHRLSTIKAAKEIIVLHHGEIIERGTHNELLAREGYYYNLYSMQFRYQELGLEHNVFGGDDDDEASARQEPPLAIPPAQLTATSSPGS
ncbi:MAG: ABC transporter ATP-binding protein/permease [Chloroflexota bacterium]|nr:ABC transporter ATP-binding protein/permease [Chloroflexota bacterium]